VLLPGGLYFGEEGGLVAGDLAGLVQQIEYRDCLDIEQVQDRLVVGVYHLPGVFAQPLSLEYLFLLFKYLVDIQLLESLIGIVNAELLKRVDLKHLKAIDIK
jgi:hypothetical protein